MNKWHNIISRILFVMLSLMTLVEINGMFMSNPYRYMQSRYAAWQKAKEGEKKEKENVPLVQPNEPFIAKQAKDNSNSYWMFHPKKTPAQRQKQSEIIRKFNPEFSPERKILREKSLA